MNCYLLEVKTTNTYPSDTTKSKNNGYIKCVNGKLYVMASSMGQAEKVVKDDWIKSITYIGEGVIVK